jgi:transcriptional regulator with XRE-family HTH domain
MVTALRRWLREQEDLTVERFAERVNVSVRAMYRYLAGERTPPLEDAIRIARATGGDVPVEHLLRARNGARVQHTNGGAR